MAEHGGSPQASSGNDPNSEVALYITTQSEETIAIPSNHFREEGNGVHRFNPGTLVICQGLAGSVRGTFGVSFE